MGIMDYFVFFILISIGRSIDRYKEIWIEIERYKDID